MQAMACSAPSQFLCYSCSSTTKFQYKKSLKFPGRRLPIRTLPHNMQIIRPASLATATDQETAVRPMVLSASLDMCDVALEEVKQVFKKMAGMEEFQKSDPFITLIRKILDSKDGHIVLYGVGREGLMMRALAMRLYHLGLDASVVGDMSTPAVGPGDLLIVSAGPGSFSTVNGLLGEARTSGAHTIVLTAQPEGAACQLAEACVWIPAQTMADDIPQDGQIESAPDTVLPMGSVYEGALFVFSEVVVRQLREHLSETTQSMRERHTNLE